MKEIKNHKFSTYTGYLVGTLLVACMVAGLIWLLAYIIKGILSLI